MSRVQAPRESAWNMHNVRENIAWIAQYVNPKSRYEEELFWDSLFMEFGWYVYWRLGSMWDWQRRPWTPDDEAPAMFIVSPEAKSWYVLFEKGAWVYKMLGRFEDDVVKSACPECYNRMQKEMKIEDSMRRAIHGIKRVSKECMDYRLKDTRYYCGWDKYDDDYDALYVRGR